MYRRLNRIKRERDREDAAAAQKAGKLAAASMQVNPGTKHEGKKSQTNLRKVVEGSKKVIVSDAPVATDGSAERLPLRAADPNIDLQ
jgi:hypothetical protein